MFATRVAPGMADAPRKPRRRVAVIGLASVGKSTFVGALHGKSAPPEPTQGCNKSTVAREELHLDLLDLGGSPEIRKFWRQLATDAHALVVMVNAAEHDDAAWVELASALRELRDSRPLLLLHNQHDTAQQACVPPFETLARLGVREPRGVRMEQIVNSSDTARAEPGLAWLCRVLLFGEDEAHIHVASAAPDGGATLVSSPSRADMLDDGATDDGGGARGPSRLRVMRTLREAREFASDEAGAVADIQQRVLAGHILSEAELEQVRAQTRG